MLMICMLPHQERSVYDPLSKPGSLIRRLHQVSVRVFTVKTEAYGLSPVQYGALQVVSDRPDIDQASLAEAADVDRTTAVRVIDRLAELGLITREVCKQDRRVRRMRITPAGTALIAQMDPAAEASQALLLAPLSATERKQFMAMLRRLVASHDQQGHTLHEGSHTAIN